GSATAARGRAGPWLLIIGGPPLRCGRMNTNDRTICLRRLRKAISREPHQMEQTATDGRIRRGDETRRIVLRRAVELASVEGLDGVTIGRLAEELSISKS